MRHKLDINAVCILCVLWTKYGPYLFWLPLLSPPEALNKGTVQESQGNNQGKNKRLHLPIVYTGNYVKNRKELSAMLQGPSQKGEKMKPVNVTPPFTMGMCIFFKVI